MVRRYLGGESPTYGPSRIYHVAAAELWTNDARRSVVDATVAGLFWSAHLHRLFDLGGLSGKPLLLRSVSLSVLFTGDFRCIAAQLVRTETGLVAGLAFVFTGVVDSLGTGWVAADLLLLSWRLLQSLLGRPARLC